MANTEEKLPKWYQHFLENYPEVAAKYSALGDAVHRWGPLDEKQRSLIKMAMSGCTGNDSAYRAHIHKAKTAGVTRKEMEHTALLAIPTAGFPAAMRMLSVIDEEM